MDFGDNSTAGFFFNTSNDTPDKEKKKEPTKAQTVTPAVICQILDHPEEEYKLFGMSTQIIKFVAVLRDVDIQSTKATYKLEDHTGTITGMWWLESDSGSNSKLPDVKLGTYVSVFGSIRLYENEKTVMIIRMFPVNNMNEVTTHLLEVIQVRLEAEAMARGRGIKSDLKASIKSNNPGSSLVNSMMGMSDSGMHIADQPMGSLGQQISKFLATANNKHGHTRQLVYQQFPSNSPKEISAALEFLIQEGHAYTTIDNDHFMTSADFV